MKTNVVIVLAVVVLILVLLMGVREGYTFTSIGGISDIINWNYEPVDLSNSTVNSAEKCAEKSSNNNYTAWTWTKSTNKCEARNYTQNPVNKTLQLPDTNPYIENRIISSGCKDINKIYPNCTNTEATSDIPAPLVVAGWSDQIINNGDKSVELKGVNTAKKCHDAAVTGKYTSWTFRNSKHPQYKNTCTASKYYANPPYVGLRDPNEHASACTDTNKIFPDCAPSENNCWKTDQGAMVNKDALIQITSTIPRLLCSEPKWGVCILHKRYPQRLSKI